METRLLISNEGSDRATAYHMSTKFADDGRNLWVTWLANPYQVRLTRIDPVAFAVVAETPLVQSYDNHCGASLALERNGRLHVVAGSHHQSFIHRWSATPTDPQSWSLPQAVGRVATYPSTAISADGRLLHVAYRSSSNPWTLVVMRAELDANPITWTDFSHSRTVLRAPNEGYCYWTNSLVVDANGTLHLMAEFYKQVAKPVGYSAAVTHLYSNDDGLNWHHTDGRPLECMPAGLEHITPILFRGGGDLRPGGMILLRDQSLAFTIYNPRNQQILLARRRPGAAWDVFDWTEQLHAKMPAGWSFCSQGSLAEDRTGRLHCALVVAPEHGFGHPTSRLMHVVADADARNLTHAELLSPWRDDHADWLPHLHKAPASMPANACLLLHQSGNKAPTNINTTNTEVALRLLTVD